jgi:3-phenylpropionate/trans-cinnamate dioxygenase ferredoxin subunit
VTSIDVGELSTFVEGIPQQTKIEGRILVLVRIGDTVYALDDRCSHEDFSLAEGEVDVATKEIECARHGAMFHLVDGTPASLPATRPVQSYDVVVKDGRVEVSVP